MDNATKKVNPSSMIETASTITAAFTRLKFITLACIVCTGLVAVGSLYLALTKFSELKRQVYVIDKGQVLSASSQDLSLSLRERIQFQSKNLHKLLFTITPNREVVQNNIEEALKISDQSVYRYYKDLNEKRFYSRMYSTGAFVDVQIDSVGLDVRRQPYQVTTYGTLTTMRESVVEKSRLVTHCQMVEVNINSKNREGLLVENFEVLRNDVYETRKR